MSTPGKREAITTHPLYQLWMGMIARCHRSKARKYENYGGRGIYVCDPWREDFWLFVTDVGPRPSPKHSLDRKDNDGPYSPDNCRWATAQEQSRNKRSTVVDLVTAEKIEALAATVYNKAEIARQLGVPYESVIDTLTGSRSLRTVEHIDEDGVVTDVPVVQLAEPPPKPGCKIGGCAEEHYGHGYCRAHHHRYVRMGETAHLYQGRSCKECSTAFPDTTSIRQLFCGARCRTAFYRKEGYYTPEAAALRPACSVADCGKPTHANGYCRHHDQRWRKYGDPLKAGFGRTNAGETTCREVGCDGAVKSRGFCAKHYYRHRNAGTLGELPKRYRVPITAEMVAKAAAVVRAARENGVPSDDTDEAFARRILEAALIVNVQTKGE